MALGQYLKSLRNRPPGHLLPFRIPFFRIFYSTTYTTLYILTLALLAITPVSMIWSAIQNSAYQYIIMIGGTYLLTALIAIFVYSSRLYTNRSVMVAVGKAYIPVEDGEVGRGVRKMIVSQLERSAIVSWESRPRDLLGEILVAEEVGVLPPETMSLGRNDYTVGKEIPIDPASPPWGNVRHAGWSGPGQNQEGELPDLQFATVIAELPNLIEAQAVSLVPPDPAAAVGPTGAPIADPVVADVLKRPATMGMREYLTQLSYLQLVNPPEAGQEFLLRYERARFGGFATTETQFKALMTSFADLLSGMTELQPGIIEQIRAQAGEDKESTIDTEETAPEDLREQPHQISIEPPESPVSSLVSPVTARTAPSRSITPYMQHEIASEESIGSVLRQPSGQDEHHEQPEDGTNGTTSPNDTESRRSDPSETGSVVRRPDSPDSNG